MNTLSNVPGSLMIPLLLVASGGLMIIAGLIALYAVKRQYRRMLERMAHMERLANTAAMDVKSLIRNRNDIEQAVAHTHRQLTKMRERQGQISQLPQVRQGPNMYEQAISLVQQGFDANQLMQTCGLSRGEAELVTSLHRH